MKDSIVAIATPYGNGGIAVIRVSGQDCFQITQDLFKPYSCPFDQMRPREMYLGEFLGGTFGDKCLAVKFVCPNSYTGENTIEFHIHGGRTLAQAIVDACVAKGARLATAGEFTKRAFLNGKISLSGAQGVIDIINATSKAEINASFSLLGEKLTSKINELADEITDVISSVDVALDYPEEDLEIDTLDEVKSKVSKVSNQVEELLKTRKTAQTVTDGVSVAIVGKPNVGKSSLLNAILGQDRAIVTSVAGTTRDTISVPVEYKGVKFIFTDTAGIRQDSNDEIEKIGIKRSMDAIKSCDIVLSLLDDKDQKFEYQDQVGSKPVLTVYNKADIKTYDESHMAISALNNTGINELMDRIYQMTVDNNIVENGLMLTSSRHYSCLLKAQECLSRALECDQLHLLTIDLREALELFGEITGQTASEKVVDSIFSKFCLGK